MTNHRPAKTYFETTQSITLHRCSILLMYIKKTNLPSPMWSHCGRTQSLAMKYSSGGNEDVIVNFYNGMIYTTCLSGKTRLEGKGYR